MIKVETWNLRKAEELKGGHPYRRPVDAATLLVLDKTRGGPLRVLMGRRHEAHKFMPSKFVFPGGRVDPADSRVAAAQDYDEGVLDKLMVEMRGPRTAARARAMAIAAIRETYEEAGILIGEKAGGQAMRNRGWEDFARYRLKPSLSGFRLLGRAITPPGRIRRFDTRFLGIWADRIAETLPEGIGPSGELEDVHWVTLDRAAELELPTITKIMLTNIHNRLAADPTLSPDYEVPYYFVRHGKFVSTTL